MPAYKQSNAEHPLEKVVADLSATVDTLNQKIDTLDPNSTQYPDPIKHMVISFAKSAVRIAAGVALIWPQSIYLAGVFIIMAEILGVFEELV